MKPQPPVSLLPQPLSLVQQIANVLRDGLQRRVWVERLPGERELSRQLNVSRPTLRAALELLQREGLIETSRGRVRTIVRPTRGKTSPAMRVVRLLVPFRLQEAPQFLFYWVDKLRALLPAAGCVLEVHSGPRWYARRPEKVLAQLIRQMPASTWVLTRATEPMQRWFASRNLRCVVAGSCYPGVNLPFVDFDHRAVARHAAAQLLKRGHRRIALLIQTPELAGDLESEAGFAAALESEPSAGAAPLIVRHDGTLPDIRRLLDRLLRLQPPPSGFFVARAASALALASELTRRGFRLPADLAVVSRDSDHFLGSFSPELARYSYDPDLFGRRLAGMVIKLATEETLSRREVRLIPDFLRGETLG